MPRQSSIEHTIPSAAAIRLRQWLDEMSMLIGYFPDLRDAVDPDELPIAFIIKRDSGMAARASETPTRSPARAGDSVVGLNPPPMQSHAGPRKQPAEQ